MMRRRHKTVAERAEELSRQPVSYHANGNVKFPVTYSQLMRECERLHALITAQAGRKEINHAGTDAPRW